MQIELHDPKGANGSRRAPLILSADTKDAMAIAKRLIAKVAGVPPEWVHIRLERGQTAKTSKH
jgi:hypothetical protein